MTVSTKMDKWLSRPQPIDDPRLRLLCFPHAGSGPTTYHKWPATLPDGVEMWGIRLPGREIRLREPAHRQIDDMVADAAAALRPFLDRPFVIFGHSLGALLGYELVRHWRNEDGPQPHHLIVSGHRAPHRPPLQPKCHQAPDAAFLQRVRRLGGTQDKFFAMTELVEMMLPTLRADFAAWETYRYQEDEILDLPITAFGSTDDSEAQEIDIAAWRQHTNHDFNYQIFSGDHFYLQTNPEPLLKQIGGILQAYL